MSEIRFPALSVLEFGVGRCRTGAGIGTAAKANASKAGAALLAIIPMLLPIADAQAQQACAPTGTNQTCTNSVTLSGGATGIEDSATLTLTNTATGAVSGTNFGVRAGTANVTNSGTISAGTNGIGIFADIANVTNSGVISAGAGGLGISAPTVNLTNSGTISAGANDTAVSADIANVSNSGTISAGASGVAVSASTANVTNSGTISTGADGVSIFGSTVNVTNSGTISAGADGFGILGSTVKVNNSGRILGGTSAISGDVANVTNSGLIFGGSFGIAAAAITATNSGTISGGVFGINAVTADVTNAGTIQGSVAALQFSGNADRLTLLPGSRIIGAINLDGGGDTVNFRGGNHNLTFDTLTGATVTGTTPFAVSGNQAAAIDLTPFAANWRSLTDFTRAVSDTVPVFGGNTPGGGGPLAFAPETSARIDDAFAAIPGLARSGEAAVFKAPTQVYSDGTAVWARGFAGQRIQQQDGVLLRNASQFYGGMLGADFMAKADLRGGFYVGGGKTRTSIDLNQGSNDSDLFFAGAYARYDRGQTFLHGAVQTGLSRNNSTRIINNNLVANGLETAVASFDGWYVSPEATVGHRFALGRTVDSVYTLTPSLRVRYLYGAYDGYTEGGTTAPLTVFGQTVSVWEERGEAKLTRTVFFDPTNQLALSLSGGVLGTQRAGGGLINATLLGQAIPFTTPGQANVWGGFGGLGVEWRSKNVSIFSAAEYLALSDNANIVSGRAGLRVGF